MTNEQRRFFRIEDCIDLSWRIAEPGKSSIVPSNGEVTDEQKLQAIDGEFNALESAIWRDDPKLAKALELLNRKIDLIISNSGLIEDAGLSENYEFSSEDLIVSLSASGIAFDCAQKFNVGDRLDMLITLKPEQSRFKALGKIVEVAENWPAGDFPYQLRIAMEIGVQDEERLVQHIVHRQVQRIAKRRNN
ncbi:MAG: hypothetical protein COA96_04775 [SAR86 cluster bacterium]|uniref:PilZ domain-containing protein n=1 Tax=SAR86 cluster bacterium TaxID=2030880 RepID=A0A2A5B6G7_9GAMM|nr:MAG: hypothetical protein COA96_04775 [SAR86 cluster bacterium]